MKITVKINTIDELRKFCDLSNNYPYDVLVQQGRWTVSGKSMMGLMSLVLLDTLDVFVDEIDEESDNFINKVKELKIEAYKTTNDAAVKAAQDAADAAQDDVDTLEGVVGDMSAVKTTSKVVAGAIDELYDALEDATEAGEVTLATAETATEGYLKTYVISQGGEEVGKIDIPKDMVVKEGSVVVDPEGQPKGTYIKLVIANDEETPIYIDVKNLVDIYKGAENADQVQITVDGYTISASIVAGSVGTTELTDAAVTTAKIADENVTKAKLAKDVQDTLDKADAAEQAIEDAIDALDSTKSQAAGADGLALEIVEEDGIITSISGSIAANTYDSYGSAKAVQDDLDNYKYDVATVTDINKLFSADEEQA